jgi:hypothetical protein
MPATYVNIATTTLGSNQNTIVFSSIPQTYTDLVLRISARSTRSGATFGSMQSQPNNAAGLISNTMIGGNAATAQYSRDSFTNDINMYESITAATATANTFGNGELYIPNYTSTGNKQSYYFGVQETNAATALLYNVATLIRSTVGITSLTLTAQAGVSNFVAGSTFYLYGIKNS